MLGIFCTIGWGNIKVYPNNEEPGFILSRGQSYIYNTESGFEIFPQHELNVEELCVEESNVNALVKQRLVIQ